MTSSASRERTYYDVLGVPQGATAEDVKAAYRKAVLCLHPDKTQSACSDLTADRNAFQKLHAAWQVSLPATPVGTSWHEMMSWSAVLSNRPRTIRKPVMCV